ncbi:GTP-binding protein [Tissierella creatinini]|nr:GTP-binding protein [Tissierella creatinini]TJX64587.1 GTP-binding protein [Soehngenia saccharolytica]
MTVKVNIISGFLGAGKTTMIKKLLAEESLGDGLAIIENEFGDISIDGDRLKEAGVEIKSISSGCICCTLSGDFQKAIRNLIKEYKPKTIIIEPTGVGMLSDIISAVNRIKESEDIELNMAMTIVDVLDFEDYIEVFGKFFADQIINANVIVLSKGQLTDENKVNDVIRSVRELNPHANMIATSWDQLKACDILEIGELQQSHSRHNHDNCNCHDHDHCHCHCHDHEHDHGQDHEDADTQFDYWSFETMKTYKKEDIESILKSLRDSAYGKVLRAKGSFLVTNKNWIDFDFTPSSFNMEEGKVKAIGQVTVIGNELDKNSIKGLFE